MLATFALLMAMAAVAATASETITNNTANLVVTLCFIARAPSASVWRRFFRGTTTSRSNRNQKLPEPGGEQSLSWLGCRFKSSVQLDQLTCDRLCQWIHREPPYGGDFGEWQYTAGTTSAGGRRLRVAR